MRRPRNIYVVGFLYGLGFNVLVTGISAVSALFIAVVTLAASSTGRFPSKTR